MTQLKWHQNPKYIKWIILAAIAIVSIVSYHICNGQNWIKLSQRYDICENVESIYITGNYPDSVYSLSWAFFFTHNYWEYLGYDAHDSIKNNGLFYFYYCPYVPPNSCDSNKIKISWFNVNDNLYQTDTLFRIDFKIKSNNYVPLEWSADTVEELVITDFNAIPIPCTYINGWGTCITPGYIRIDRRNNACNDIETAYVIANSLPVNIHNMEIVIKYDTLNGKYLNCGISDVFWSDTNSIYSIIDAKKGVWKFIWNNDINPLLIDDTLISLMFNKYNYNKNQHINLSFNNCKISDASDVSLPCLYTNGYLRCIYKLDNTNDLDADINNKNNTIKIFQTYKDKENIRIYPNPVNDIIYIEGIYDKLIILDISGRIVFQCNYSKKININLDPGIYIIKIYNHDGIFTEKLIINRN